jgi:hypothetical protein
MKKPDLEPRMVTPLVTLLLVPIRIHERHLAQELIEATRALAIDLLPTESTEIIRGRLLPSKVPYRCRLVALDAGRFGSLPDAIRLISEVLDKDGEVLCRDFRLIRDDDDYPSKASVLVFLALIRKQYRSQRIREGLYLTRERNGVISPNRKTISPELKEQIRQTYRELKSLRLAALKHGISRTSAFRVIHEGESDE